MNLIYVRHTVTLIDKSKLWIDHLNSPACYLSLHGSLLVKYLIITVLGSFKNKLP